MNHTGKVPAFEAENPLLPSITPSAQVAEIVVVDLKVPTCLNVSMKPYDEIDAFSFGFKCT